MIDFKQCLPCNRALTAAAGFALGDVVAQASTRHPGQRYDYVRTARMTAFGLAFAGPLQGHYWYQWLDKVSYLPVWVDYWQCIVQHLLLTMMCWMGFRRSCHSRQQGECPVVLLPGCC